MVAGGQSFGVPQVAKKFRFAVFIRHRFAVSQQLPNVCPSSLCAPLLWVGGGRVGGRCTEQRYKNKCLHEKIKIFFSPAPLPPHPNTPPARPPSPARLRLFVLFVCSSARPPAIVRPPACYLSARLPADGLSFFVLLGFVVADARPARYFVRPPACYLSARPPAICPPARLLTCPPARLLTVRPPAC